MNVLGMNRQGVKTRRKRDEVEKHRESDITMSRGLFK